MNAALANNGVTNDLPFNFFMDPIMDIQIANTDAEIRDCYPVMRELRTHIPEAEFLARIRYQQSDGYQLAYMSDKNIVVAVAGFRIMENLAWGRFMYIDDLVTVVTNRSRGFGTGLLTWLRNCARKEGCVQLHLDSGIQRTDAHRFYKREGLPVTGYHFAEILVSDNND